MKVNYFHEFTCAVEPIWEMPNTYLYYFADNREVKNKDQHSDTHALVFFEIDLFLTRRIEGYYLKLAKQFLFWARLL